MKSQLVALFKGRRVLILGVGNRMRGDDAVGSLLAAALQGETRLAVIDAEDVPENYLGPVERARADLVLVLDAAEMGAQPGETALVPIDQVMGDALSTHHASLGLLFAAIPAEHRPEVWVLGIQPAGCEFGQPVSAEVRATMELLRKMILDIERFVEG